VTVAGGARRLSSSAREQPAPDVGRSGQPLLLGTAVLLILFGQVLRLGGWGWGVSVAGGVLVLVWFLGLPVDGLPAWPALPGRLPGRRWRWLVMSGTWALGAVAGAVVATLLGAGVLLGVLLGGPVTLAALAAWALVAERRSADNRSRAAEGTGVAAVRAAREEAELAVAARDNAVAAVAEHDMRGWSEHAGAAATHAARAERRAEEAQAAVSADDRPGADRRAVDAVTRVAARVAAAASQAAHNATEVVDAEEMAIWGDRVGRVAGSVVSAVVVVAIARATALDAYVRETPNWSVIGWPLAGAFAAGASGVFVYMYRARRLGGRYPIWATAWFWFTVAALVAGGWLLADGNAIVGAESGGSVALLLGGFTLFTGVLALVAVAVRRGPIAQYALVPAVRSLHFTRFPVLLFLLAWAVAVSALDTGGFHDIRRYQRDPAAVAPTIGQVWQRYVEVAPPGGGARPVVLVAAQGGGIRAAVWTALVMECLFGPGPVAASGTLCAEGDGTPDPARMAVKAAAPLPVFIASGASGGSVGLAAWSARRADLIQEGPGSNTPRTVEDALNRDFVAPDVARLMLADAPHSFLAWNRPDRAEMLERGWERPWLDRPATTGTPAGAAPAGSPSPRRGLARGLRETWEVTHAGGAWSTPVLAFNGASVEDDCRFVASAVDFTLPRQLPADPADVATAVDSTDDRPDDAACRGVGGGTGKAVDLLPSTTELVDYLCPDEDVPLSTAAHLSARFPYVSPTGRVERRGCPDARGLVPAPAISYDADGGIFDNSGAGTAVDTWRALGPLAAATERQGGTCLVPVFVQIDNSPPSATVGSTADPRPDELTAPVGATLNQVSSRDRYARSGAAAAFGRLVSADGERVHAVGAGDPDGLWFRIALYGQPGPEPPLGWTLAPETVSDMRSQLRAITNAKQIQALRRLLRPGGLTCGRS
jgi:hypothetical protein